jgi:hypothetical protein
MMKCAFSLALLLTTTGAYAACIGDSLEIGDIGPAADLLCSSLDAKHPGQTVEITQRHVQSGERISIDYSVSQQKHQVDYRLVGADWIPVDPMVAETH